MNYINIYTKKWSLYWNLFYFYRFLEVGYWHPAQIFTFDCFLFYMEKSKIINFKRKLCIGHAFVSHFNKYKFYFYIFIRWEKQRKKERNQIYSNVLLRFWLIYDCFRPFLSFWCLKKLFGQPGYMMMLYMATWCWILMQFYASNFCGFHMMSYL